MPWVKRQATETGAVLLDTLNGQYWHLNVLGGRLLDALVTQERIEDLAITLAEEYPVDAETIHRDLSDVLEDLEAKRLIERDSR